MLTVYGSAWENFMARCTLPCFTRLKWSSSARSAVRSKAYTMHNRWIYFCQWRLTSSIWRKSSNTCFPMSPRGPSYVVNKLPKGWLQNTECPKFEHRNSMSFQNYYRLAVSIIKLIVIVSKLFLQRYVLNRVKGLVLYVVDLLTIRSSGAFVSPTRTCSSRSQ